MDVRRRPPKPSSRSPPPPMEPYHNHHQKPSSPELINDRSPSPTPKASYALHLPLYLTNAIFFTLIFFIAYYLLHRWRDKIRSSTPLHVLTLSELAAILSLIASFIYLLGFFGIGFVQSFISRSSNDAWEVDDQQQRFIIDDEDSSRPGPCPAALDCATPKLMDSLTLTPLSTEEDEELVKSVVSGQIPSYSLESKLGDCHRAASIRREAVQRLTGRSLSGLPLDGFDYDSILGRKQD